MSNSVLKKITGAGLIIRRGRAVILLSAQDARSVAVEGKTCDNLKIVLNDSRGWGVTHYMTPQNIRFFEKVGPIPLVMELGQPVAGKGYGLSGWTRVPNCEAPDKMAVDTDVRGYDKARHETGTTRR